VLQHLPVERRPKVLARMRYEVAAEMIGRLAPEEAAGLLDNLESDDAVDILGRIDEDKLRQILARFDAADAHALEELLAYPENSAGGIMSPSFFSVHQDVTIAEATRLIQTAEELPQHVHYLYVVDEHDRLVGVIGLRDLVLSKPDQPIHSVMATELVMVTADTDQEKVAECASRYDLVAIPVVDDQRRLLGVVTIDDIVDVLREEATEDILRMAGAGHMLVDTREFWRAFARACRGWGRRLRRAAGGGLAAGLRGRAAQRAGAGAVHAGGRGDGRQRRHPELDDRRARPRGRLRRDHAHRPPGAPRSRAGREPGHDLRDRDRPAVAAARDRPGAIPSGSD
jgi:magnesium transporter